MKRNGHLIGLSRGHIYKLDRSSRTTYTNADYIYIYNYSEIVSAGAAEVIETPEWYDN